MVNFKKYHLMLLLVIVVAVTIITSGCVSNTNNEIDTKDENPVTVPNSTPNKDTVSQNNIDDTPNEELYRLFLENSVNVNIDNSEYSLSQYIEAKGASGMKFEYTFFDMTGDGISEFHLKSPRSYDIFTINDEKIKLWYEGSPYENFTSDGNILYCRHGGAPNNEQYIFKELDSDGNVVSEVTWSVYEPDDRGSITSNSVFYNGDGEEISEDEYYELMGKYDTVIYDYEWFVFYENLTTMIWENIDKEKQTNITIQYPALYGMNDENLQDKINTTIKEAALSKYNDFFDMGLDFDKTAWPVEYTVEYMSDRYISVVFNGYIYTMGAAHGTDWKYAVTVDMTTGEKVKLSDIFDDSFIDYLTFENFGECIEIDFSGAFSEATDLIFANMKEEFARDWDNLSYDYFHFANDSFHITYAPQSSFFCFKSDYEALTPCMKDHPIWQELEPILEYDEKFDSATIKENEFFPYRDGDVVDYTGDVILDKAEKVSGKVDVELLKSCTDGNIFVLRFKDLYKSIAERSNLYFFVSENSIWKLNLHDLLVDDVEKVIESIDSYSDLMNFDMSSNNIFCMVSTNDVSLLNTNSDAIYYNDGLISEYRYSNSLVETGYYETVVFEQNIGLTKYISGFGALRDHVDLTLIETK